MNRLKDIHTAIQQKWGHRALQIARHLERDSLLASGIPALDTLTAGGLPHGKSSVFTGRPTSGKTTTAYQWLAAAQRNGKEIVYLDTHGVFDPAYASACGMELNRLLIARPAHLLDGLEFAREAAASGLVGVIVLDIAKMTLPLYQLRLHHTVLLILSPVMIEGAQVHLHFQRCGWLTEGKNVVGCEIETQLRKHPTLVPARIQYSLLFPEVNT